MNLRTWLIIGSICILLAGLGSAVAIYQSTVDEPSHVLGYETGDESAYPVRPEDSKSYLRDLEFYGGKSNVLATQFRHWISGLFRGRSLALIVALFSVLLSYGAFYAAGHLPPRRVGRKPRKSMRGRGSALAYNSRSSMIGVCPLKVLMKFTRPEWRHWSMHRWGMKKYLIPICRSAFDALTTPSYAWAE